MYSSTPSAFHDFALNARAASTATAPQMTTAFAFASSPATGRAIRPALPAPEQSAVEAEEQWVPLFNGKDLTGWKEFPGKKSKFAVIDNAINVKDGPGDLQTVGKYKDFILQLECKSNGKHLNSGVFFRCLPGQFWSGYEAQVRNQ